MESSLHQDIPLNEITHLQRYYRLLSVFKKIMIHTDLSDVQLGVVIIQEGKSLDFYSHK